ncbi:MAG: hypothetical protein COV66_09025 [Nitrospinae bacterium CG11_big_fil_rev_8_21_14_0_20_45_15]|nr:MAG: hypothetical protein COV66_09025 [Nitrospinae bacterium CG11_big_fil_rev_8_21_14_0_20_45_15]
MSPLHRFISNLPWTTVGKIVVHLQLFVISILLTRYLGKDQLGIYASLLAVPVFVRLLNAMGLETALNKNLPELDVQDPSGAQARWLTFRLLKIRFASSAVLFAAIYLLFPIYAEMIGRVELTEYRGTLAFYFLAITLDSFMSSLFMTRLKYRLITIAETSCAFLNLIFLGLFIFLDLGVRGVMLAYILSVGINLLLYFLWGHHEWGAPRERPPAGDALGLAINSWLIALLGFGLMTQSDIVLMNFFHIESASIGFYHLATGLGGMMAFLLIGVAPMALSLFSETFARSARAGLERLFQDILGIACFLTAPIYAFFIFNAEPILQFIYGSDFTKASPLLIAFAIFAGLQTVLGINFSYSLLFVLQRRQMALRSTAEASILNLALNFILIPTYGAMGAVAGTGVSMLYMVLRQLHALAGEFDVVPALRAMLERLLLCISAAVPGVGLSMAGIDSLALNALLYLISFFTALVWFKPLNSEWQTKIEESFPGWGKRVGIFVRSLETSSDSQTQ